MDATGSMNLSLARQTLNFGRHFVEMCVSMCVGGAALNALVFAGIPALTGSGDLRSQFPELSLMVIALLLTVPMAAWMRFRGMAWRPTLEMSAVAIVLAALIIGGAWTGIAPASILAIGFGRFCGIACVGMLAVMLFRLDLYVGRSGHHTAHAGAH
jgi:hypothetical protein